MPATTVVCCVLVCARPWPTLQSVPGVLLVFIAASASDLNRWVITAVVGCILLPDVAAGVQQRVEAFRRSDFVQAATELGLRDSTTLWREIVWHNVRGYLIERMAVVFHAAVLMDVTLSYVGLRDGQRVSLGGMLKSGRSSLTSGESAAEAAAALTGVLVIIVTISMLARWMSAHDGSITMTAPSLLTIQNLCVDFLTAHGPLRAVDGCNMAIAPGERVGIVGESGSGKSQTLVSIFGLQPTVPRTISGHAQFHGRSGPVDLLQRDPLKRDALLGREVAMMFQDPSPLVDSLIGRLRSTSIMCCVGPHEAGASAAPSDVLASMGFENPQHILRAFPQQLSGGEAQRALLAISMLMRPQLLIADEPTTGLDLVTQSHVLQALRQQQAAHQFAPHSHLTRPGCHRRMVDRVIVMEKGRIVEQATADHLRRAPDDALHPYTAALRASHRRRTSGAAVLAPNARSVAQATALAEKTPLLAVRGLTKDYPARRRLFATSDAPRRTVDDVSFSLERGEVLGLSVKAAPEKPPSHACCCVWLTRPRARCVWTERTFCHSMPTRYVVIFVRASAWCFKTPMPSSIRRAPSGIRCGKPSHSMAPLTSRPVRSRRRWRRCCRLSNFRHRSRRIPRSVEWRPEAPHRY